jgi:hypothetical protein
MVRHQRAIVRVCRVNFHGGPLAAIGMEFFAKRKKELPW